MLQDILGAYEVFGNAGKEKAMKVIIDAEGVDESKAATTKKRELAEV